MSQESKTIKLIRVARSEAKPEAQYLAKESAKEIEIENALRSPFNAIGAEITLKTKDGNIVVFNIV